MLAPEFSRAQTARISDFSTSRAERGVFWLRPRRSRQTLQAQDHGEGSNVSVVSGQDLNAFSTISTRTHSGIGNTSSRSIPSIPLDHRRTSSSQARLPSSRTRPSSEHRLVRGKLIAQFAASNGKTLADACEIINVPPNDIEEDSGGQRVGNSGPGGTNICKEEKTARLVDGVDLNCVSTRLSEYW
jgi:tRNA-dihydrouridine synthase 4